MGAEDRREAEKAVSEVAVLGQEGQAWRLEENSWMYRVLGKFPPVM